MPDLKIWLRRFVVSTFCLLMAYKYNRLYIRNPLHGRSQMRYTFRVRKFTHWSLKKKKVQVLFYSVPPNFRNNVGFWKLPGFAVCPSGNATISDTDEYEAMVEWYWVGKLGWGEPVTAPLCSPQTLSLKTVPVIIHKQYRALFFSHTSYIADHSWKYVLECDSAYVLRCQEMNLSGVTRNTWNSVVKSETHLSVTLTRETF